MTEITADMDVAPEKQTNKATPRDDSVVNPGDLTAKLKACRDEAELSVEQAAVEMRLSAAMVRAMEAENFSELPDPPYVRGYLRSYARLNGSDPKNLIRTYELLRGADPDSFAFTPTVPLNRVAKPRMSATTLKTLLLIFGVFLLGILSMIPGVSQWAGDTWRAFSAQTAESHPATIAASNAAGEVERSPEANASLATSTNDSATPASTDTLVTPTAAAPLPTADSMTTDDTGISNGEAPPPEADASQELVAPAETGDETPSPDADLADSEQGSTDTSIAAPGTAPTTDATTATDPVLLTTTDTATDTDTSQIAAAAETTTPVDPPDQTDQAAASTDASTVNPDGAAESTPTPTTVASTFSQPIDGEVVVRMEFTQEVWMQVKDGNNKSIFEALNTANTWKEFKTRTPLSFKIGNAPGVRVYLNGQLFDQASHTRGSVARFTVN